MVKRLNPIFNLKKKVLCGWIQTLELSVQKVQHSTNRFDEHEGNMEFSVQRSGSLGVSQPLSPLQCLARQAIHPQKLGPRSKLRDMLSALRRRISLQATSCHI